MLLGIFSLVVIILINRFTNSNKCKLYFLNILTFFNFDNVTYKSIVR